MGENQESNETNTESTDIKETNEKRDLSHRLGTIGWALFFIWIGIAFLAKFNIGVSLLGIGIIILGMQIVRKFYNLKFEGFWAVVGLIFTVGGIWETAKPSLPLVPIILIIAGVLLLLSTFCKKYFSK